MQKVDSFHFLRESTTPPALLPLTPAHIPGNALQLLDGAVERQQGRDLSFAAEALEAANEARAKAQRLPLLRRQRRRRAALDAEDQRASEETAALLEALAGRVRERAVSLAADGYQTFVFENEDVYEGHWKACKMHGKGCLKRAGAADVYEGQWFMGMRSGTGMYHNARFQTLYSGGWLDGRRHGKGEMLEVEGLYTGEFVDNKIMGYGEYVYNDGHIYKGEWAHGLYHGTGAYLFPGIAKYEGGWCRGREHGRGTMSYFNEDIYTGDWRHGQRHGTGTYTSALTGVYEGEWAYDEIDGFGICHFNDGCIYEGQWKKGRFHGKGVFSNPALNMTYNGDFIEGKRHGYGIFVSDDVHYDGNWEKDKKHGKGTLLSRGGGLFVGTFANDEPNGPAVHTSKALAALERERSGFCSSANNSIDHSYLESRRESDASGMNDENSSALNPFHRRRSPTGNFGGKRHSTGSNSYAFSGAPTSILNTPEKEKKIPSAPRVTHLNYNDNGVCVSSIPQIMFSGVNVRLEGLQEKK